MTETDRTVRSTAAGAETNVDATLGWLSEEFPGWRFDVEATVSWHEDLRPIWIARREGHHPQSELTAAKLHTRLSEYLERTSRRRAAASN